LRQGNYDDNIIDTDESDEDAHSGVRRSKRATKGLHMQFWKNERSVYAKGVLVGVLHAEETPKRQRRVYHPTHTTKKVSKRLHSESEGEEEMPLPKLPPKVNYINRYIYIYIVLSIYT
jgi:hypothetical protein